MLLYEVYSFGQVPYSGMNNAVSGLSPNACSDNVFVTKVKI